MLDRSAAALLQCATTGSRPPPVHASAWGRPITQTARTGAQVLDQHRVDGESPLAEPVGQLVPDVPGSLRREVARVPEDVDGAIPREAFADGTEPRLGLQPEGSDEPLRCLPAMPQQSHHAREAHAEAVRRVACR